MAIDSASIGANFSDYRGDAMLGGANVGKVDIDTRPLQQLAQYTFYFKRDKWQQLQQQTDAKIKQLADLSKIALNDLYGKDKEEMTTAFTELQKKAAEYAAKDSTNPKERLQDELEWQTTLGAFNNNFNSGKTRAVTFHKLQNDILSNAALSGSEKKDKIDKLTAKFNDTDIGTPISSMEEFPIQNFDVPAPVTQKLNIVGIGANENYDIDANVFNPKLNSGTVDATILGIHKAYINKDSQEYNSLSQIEKDQVDAQQGQKSLGKGWVDATTPLNDALKKYINQDGTFDANRFEDENSSNTTLMNAYNALKNYDAYNRDKYNQAKAGAFNDKGVSIPLPPNVNADDWKVGFVDFSKGVTANQLLGAGSFAKFQGDVFAKKITPTDNAIQRENISQGYAQLNETIRHNKATENLDSEKQKTEQEKWKATQKGGETQINGAIERAKRIYDDMLKLADKNGVISPDKIRRLNVEQLKYLGIESPEQRDEYGKITTAGGFKPLDLSGSKYAIQLVDGEIRVLKDAKLSETGSGSYKGLFDQTKSTNLYNIGTNILNEELKNAGSKELNSYYGIDVTNQPTSTTSGGSSTIEGSTKQTMSDKDYEDFLKKNGLK